MENKFIETGDTVRIMLNKLSTLWKTRAAVNQEIPDYYNLAFDSDKKDFTASLLPFRDHQAWLEAPEELRDKCLSYAWGIYNLKTIYIECDVVTPACEDIIKTPPQSENRALLQDMMSQALLDEALHTRMSIIACLSNWLSEQRKSKGLTMRDVAEIIGKPHSYIGKVERGERKIDVVEYVWYCKLVGLNPIDGINIIMLSNKEDDQA